MVKRIYIILSFIYFCTLSAGAQYAVITGPELEINDDMFGYNTNTYLRGPLWSDSDFRNTAGRLYMGNIRYPAGTGSNYWDWRTGNIMKTINKGWPKWVNDDWTYTPATFVAGIPEHANVVYCINMARPTPVTGIDPYSSIEVLKSQSTLKKKIEDIIAGIDAFFAAGCELKRVELGNEFYHGAVGGVDEQGSIYTGMPGLYINHANQIAQAIHDKYPKIEIAVIGESSRSDSEPVTPWTQAIYDAVANGSLNHIDAITFHWYSGPGTSQLNNAIDAMKSLAQTFNAANKARGRDYLHVPDALDIWVTEYNTWSKVGEPDNGGPIQDTWINGMFAANLSLLYTIMGPKVKLLDIHVLGQGAHLQWEMLNNQNTLSGNGIACGAVGRAMLGMNKMQVLDFKDIPNHVFTNGWPSLVGAKFWNEEKQRTSVLIINCTNETKHSINTSSLFEETANKQLIQFYDETPWTKGLTENEGVDLNIDYNVGDMINIPPFSISIISQEYSNIIINPGFEMPSLDGWIGDGLLDKTYKNAYSGTSSMLIEQNEASVKVASQKTSVTGDKTHHLKAQIRTLLESGNAYLEVKFMDANDVEIENKIQGRLFGGKKAYIEDEITFTTPATATSFEIRLVLDGIGKTWFDQVVLTRDDITNVVTVLDAEKFLSVYPNPSNERINIQLINKKYGDLIKTDIYRIDGKLLESYYNKERLQLDVSFWSKGIYILLVQLADYPYPLVSKLVVK